jgi:hypothetical protein
VSRELMKGVLRECVSISEGDVSVIVSSSS